MYTHPITSSPTRIEYVKPVLAAKSLAWPIRSFRFSVNDIGAGHVASGESNPGVARMWSILDIHAS